MSALASPVTDDAILLRSDDAGVATLTLNRPAARNSLSTELMGLLQDAFDAIAEDPDVRVVVVAASAPGFCAGHDLKELRANHDAAFFQRVFDTCSRMMQSLTRLPQPAIAKIDGVASAAGLQLVATCDLAIASDRSQFATPGVNIGLFCTTPMVALARNVGRKHALELLLTGDAIDAASAARMGLINRAVPAKELDDAVAELAAKIASKSPDTMAMGKRAFYDQIELGVAEAYDYASETMTRNMLARDAGEGIDAFIEKRAPVWRGE